jgi:hypothetical protein
LLVRVLTEAALTAERGLPQAMAVVLRDPPQATAVVLRDPLRAGAGTRRLAATAAAAGLHTAGADHRMAAAAVDPLTVGMGGKTMGGKLRRILGRRGVIRNTS